MLLFLKVRKSPRCSQGSNVGGGFGKMTTFLIKKFITFSIYLGLNLSISANRSSSWSLSLSLSNRPIIPKFTQLGIWVSYHRVLCFDFRGRGTTSFFLFFFNSKIYKKKSQNGVVSAPLTTPTN